MQRRNRIEQAGGPLIDSRCRPFQGLCPVHRAFCDERVDEQVFVRRSVQRYSGTVLGCPRCLAFGRLGYQKLQASSSAVAEGPELAQNFAVRFLLVWPTSAEPAASISSRRDEPRIAQAEVRSPRRADRALGTRPAERHPPRRVGTNHDHIVLPQRLAAPSASHLGTWDNESPFITGPWRLAQALEEVSSPAENWGAPGLAFERWEVRCPHDEGTRSLSTMRVFPLRHLQLLSPAALYGEGWLRFMLSQASKSSSGAPLFKGRTHIATSDLGHPPIRR